VANAAPAFAYAKRVVPSPSVGDCDINPPVDAFHTRIAPSVDADTIVVVVPPFPPRRNKHKSTTAPVVFSSVNAPLECNF
jgi:hypothetical protein